MTHCSNILSTATYFFPAARGNNKPHVSKELRKKNDTLSAQKYFQQN